MTSTPWCKTPSGARSLLAFLTAVVFAVVAGAQTQTPIFPVLPFNFALMPNYYAATGDFNGDGRIDEATQNGISIGISLNNGPASPPTLTSIPLSCTPQSILAVDLNNDGKLDLAFSCQLSNVGVMLGNGDGTFQSASYYAILDSAAPASRPSLGQIALVDLDGNGYLDLAVIVNSHEVSVLLNQGSSKPGSFSPAVSYPTLVGTSMTTISTGDFNGDGKQDIAAGNGSIAVYYGNGDGTLGSPQLAKASTILGTQNFVTGDFNRDGLTDIAFLESNSQSPTSPFSPEPPAFEILFGDPTGEFVTGPELTLDPSANYQWIVPFQNTNTDNITNFALIGNVTSIALNDGKGGLSLGESYALSAFAVAQTGSNGNTNLYFQSNVESVLLAGNGNGTFQGPKATLLGGGVAAVSADLNGDGLTDVLSIDAGGNLVAALDQGAGTFSVASRTPGSGQLLATGDFNGDGKLDAVTILPGLVNTADGTPISPGQIFVYQGNGDGTFQPNPTVIPLVVSAAGTPLVGDFNGDSKLDLVLPYGMAINGTPQPPSGVLFLAGNGNGTFAAPVSLPIPYTSIGFAADLNNDHKLDILGGGFVYLGNGDGTFTQKSSGIPTPILAVGDLNGDGKSDIAAVGGGTLNLYAGNGDGTFQTTPFYTAPNYNLAGGPALVAIGDVNGDGHPDFSLQYDEYPPGQTIDIEMFLGDGTGNFTLENTYHLQGFSDPGFVSLTRLNSQAPTGTNDHTLDYIFVRDGAATSLLNQLNPAPSGPTPLASKTVLTASATSAAPGQQLTFAAAVTGAMPTGTISFFAGGKALGTAPITNGTATLAVSFPAAGMVAVIANYPGDSNNAPSSSNPVSVAIAPVASKTVLELSFTGTGLNLEPLFYATVSGLNPTGTVTFNAGTTTLGTAPVLSGTASFPHTFLTGGDYPVVATYSGDVANLASTSNAVTIFVPEYLISTSATSAVVKAGQSAITTFTVNSSVGYTGTLKFSCGPLPTGVTCTFTPASITPSSGPATTTLTVTTTAPTTALLRRLSVPLQGTALASFLFLILIPRRSSKWRRSGRLIALMMAAALMSLSGCSSSSHSSSGSNTPGTPAGLYNIVVNVTDSTNNAPAAEIDRFQVMVQ